MEHLRFRGVAPSRNLKLGRGAPDCVVRWEYVLRRSSAATKMWGCFVKVSCHVLVLVEEGDASEMRCT